MARISFTGADGSEQTLDVADGMTVMEAGIGHDVDGILAECGGACACATCHVYVDQAWIERVGPPNEIEREMLELASDVRPGSRLSCQIKVSDALDGLHVTVAQQI